MDPAAIEWISDVLVAELARGEAIDSTALTFLLRRYRATGRADLCDALEPALARALECHETEETPIQRAAWLKLFAEATGLSNDERLHRASESLEAALRREWGGATAVDAAAASVDACLTWSQGLSSQTLLAHAIDELERIVAAAYHPEDGLARLASRSCDARGHLADHVGLAATLLTAYDVTGRLPYPMLAEELMQSARRALWDAEAGAFCESRLDRNKPFVLNCDAALVLCRLAELHGTDDYRQAAVVAPGASYADDAARLLGTQGERYREVGSASAAYGLALAAWLTLR